MEIEEFKNYFLINGIRVHWNFKFLPKGYETITLFGHVFDVRKKEDLREFLNTEYGRIMVNHERIHMLQAESFKFKYLTFYMLYIFYLIVGLFKHGTEPYMAYYSIPFEKEAYRNERNMSYSASEWEKYIER